MKKVLLLISFLCISVPAFSYSELGETKSLEFLNRSVYNEVSSINRILYVNYDKIMNIIELYRQNPQAIKTADIQNFSKVCMAQHTELLNKYESNYFIPAYNEYKKYDKSLTLEDWKNSIGLSEQSLFYDFYTFTEHNLEDCKKIYERSK